MKRTGEQLLDQLRTEIAVGEKAFKKAENKKLAINCLLTFLWLCTYILLWWLINQSINANSAFMRFFAVAISMLISGGIGYLIGRSR